MSGSRLRMQGNWSPSVLFLELKKKAGEIAAKPTRLFCTKLDRWQMARRFKTGGRQKGSKNKRTANNTIEKVHYAISDEPMTIEEWVAKFTKGN